MTLLIFITIPLIASIVSLLIKKKTQILNFIAIAASAVELIATAKIILSVAEQGSYSLNGLFSVDYLGAILIMVVSFVGFLASWYSVGYLKTEVAKEIIGFRRVRQYFVLLHLFLLAMFFAIITTNPILMWVAIEATTLSTAFLISFYNKPSAMEAAWKYLIINSVGLLLAFFGTLLFLSPELNFGHHGLIDWHSILLNAKNFDPFVIKIAFIFILIGYGTKVGFVPMHTWRPDAYSKAPIPVVALLSGSLLNVAFLAILRFKSITDLSVGKEFSQNLLISFGIVSIMVAAFSIFSQKNYKRLLAYSSIEHAGIMALGFGFGGAGVFAAILHMIYHSLAKSLLFLSAGNIFLKYSSTKIYNVRGLISALPVTSVIFVIGFLAITGVPPFGIFLTEFSILSAGVSAHPAITIIALSGLVLVFVGFLKQIASMVFGIKDENISKGEAGIWTTAPIIIIAVILIAASFYIPSFVKILINGAVSIY